MRKTKTPSERISILAKEITGKLSEEKSLELAEKFVKIGMYINTMKEDVSNGTTAEELNDYLVPAKKLLSEVETVNYYCELGLDSDLKSMSYELDRIEVMT